MKAQRNRVVRLWVGLSIFAISFILLILSITEVLDFGYGEVAFGIDIIFSVGVIAGALMLGTGFSHKNEFYFYELLDKQVIKIISIEQSELSDATLIRCLAETNWGLVLVWLERVSFYSGQIQKGSYVKINNKLHEVGK